MASDARNEVCGDQNRVTQPCGTDQNMILHPPRGCISFRLVVDVLDSRQPSHESVGSGGITERLEAALSKPDCPVGLLGQGLVVGHHENRQLLIGIQFH